MRLSRRPRVAWLLSVVVLVAALAFAACGARAPQSGGNGYSGTTTSQNSGQGTTSTTTGQTSSEQAVQSIDQSVQSTMQSLQSAQNDANTDYSSQDNPVVP